MAISVLSTAAKTAQGTVTLTWADFSYTELLNNANYIGQETSLAVNSIYGNGTATWSTAQAHSGTHSALLTSTAASTPFTWLNSNTLYTNAGATLLSGAWVYQTQASNRNCSVGADWKDGGGVWLGGMSGSSTSVPPNTWTFIYKTGVAVPGMIYGTLTIAYTSLASGENFYYDDFTFRRLVSANDVLVAFVYEQGQAGGTMLGGLTTPAGWTQQSYNFSNTTGMGLGIYTRVAGSSEGSYIWTEANSASATVTAEVVVLGGVNTFALVDGAVPAITNSLGATTSQIAPAVSVSYASSLLISGWATGPAATGAGSYAAPGSMTKQLDTQYSATGTYNMFAALATEQLSATGSTGTRTSTASRSNGTTDAFVAGSIAILAASPHQLGTLGVGK